MAKTATKAEPFKWSANDPLAEQHELIRTVVRGGCMDGGQPHYELDLYATDVVVKMLAATPRVSGV